MGVSNLFKYCKFTDIDPEALKGKRIAIDMYVIFHKFSVDVQTAKQLVDDPGVFIPCYYENIRNYLHNFLEDGFSLLYLVYDGTKMKHKITEEDRARARQKAFENENWVSAVEIAPQQMYNFQQYLNENPLEEGVVEYIVAPFEADAQLTYLYKQGYVDYVLTNDSDLIIYGVGKLLMIRQNQVVEYRSDVADKHEKVEWINQVDKRKLWLFGFLIGCDYYRGVPGIGVVKAFKVITHLKLAETGNAVDWDCTFYNLLGTMDALRVSKSKVIEKEGLSWKEGFDRVRMVYTMQPVFDPADHQLKFLDGSPVKEVEREEFGHIVDVDQHQKGVIDPMTGKLFELKVSLN